MNNIEFTRQELYKLVWENPLNQITVKYSIAKSDVKKACIAMKVPLPVSSYWRSFNLKPKPLPELTDAFMETKSIKIPLIEKKNILRKSFNSKPDFDLAVSIMNDPNFILHLPDQLHNPCTIIFETKKYHVIRNSYGVFPYHKCNGQILNLSTAEINFERVLIFLDALIKLLNFRGQQVEINTDGTGLFFLNEVSQTELLLREGCRKVFCKSSNRERTTEFTGKFIVKIKNESVQKELREVDILKESSVAHIVALIELIETEKSRITFESIR